jgi:hypothetical protein
MRTIETKVYFIDEHPNPEVCYENFRNNGYDLNEYDIEELIESLKQLAKITGGTLDYTISLTSDPSDYITISNYDKDILYRLSVDDYPLTGVYWDFYVIKALRNRNFNEVLKTLYENTDYAYSDEGLFEHFTCNEYEFTEEGELI